MRNLRKEMGIRSSIEYKIRIKFKTEYKQVENI